jgi:hypothetical protein
MSSGIPWNAISHIRLLLLFPRVNELAKKVSQVATSVPPLARELIHAKKIARKLQHSCSISQTITRNARTTVIARSYELA